jgi:Mrp family chromosome partitioning ATPase
VLDCPPVIGLAETSILASRADAVLVVVNARKVNFDRLVQGITQLRTSGANVVGIVLNRVRRPHDFSPYGYSGPSEEATPAERSYAKIRRFVRSG